MGFSTPEKCLPRGRFSGVCFFEIQVMTHNRDDQINDFSPNSTEEKKAVEKPSAEPLLVSAEVAARISGRSVASWWRDRAAGRTPAPIRLGGRTLWRIDEIRAWIAVGCPDRQK
jgi:predicted DNA-binding transcriptional regulator AlpA